MIGKNEFEFNEEGWRRREKTKKKETEGSDEQGGKKLVNEIIKLKTEIRATQTGV